MIMEEIMKELKKINNRLDAMEKKVNKIDNIEKKIR